MKVLKTRRKAIMAGCVSMLLTGKASAMVFVFDIPNFLMNAKILKQLEENKEGTINYNTSISADIDQTNVLLIEKFKWVVNNNYDKEGEIVPIPWGVEDFLSSLKGTEATEAYSARFQSADGYADGRFDPKSGYDGSRARKAANDVWIKSIEAHQQNLGGEAAAVGELMKRINGTVGHGKQQQISNAIASSQVNQLMQMRSMMLVSETARLAESQAAADKEARALAVGTRLREGLEEATGSSPPIKKAPESFDMF